MLLSISISIHASSKSTEAKKPNKITNRHIKHNDYKLISLSIYKIRPMTTPTKPMPTVATAPLLTPAVTLIAPLGLPVADAVELTVAVLPDPEGRMEVVTEPVPRDIAFCWNAAKLFAAEALALIAPTMPLLQCEAGTVCWQ